MSDPDQRRRHAAVGEIARQMVKRLRSFDIQSEDTMFTRSPQQTLFPDDMGPIGMAQR
ncbi:hypothetical protein [Tardibacter chloracetimidivorans]|uniref:hypothetical protein n=1 Tax=Tardibacter chloracetimidivorans TaxID=1921510 RepID=UPI0013018269|nr:hypothetical protein [Tardibacter chloracetimidivorans]